MKLIKKATLILMALAISIGLVITTSQPVSAAVEEPQKCTRWHTVKQGEYLSLIAEQYDTNWYSLAKINRLTNPSLIFAGNKLCIFSSEFQSNPPIALPGSSSNANIVALSVKEDQVVTIQGKNLSPNTRYKVYQGKYNADPALSVLVGTAYTDKNGSFKETYSIPKKLFDVLKIRISVTNQRGGSTSNWFINATSTGNTGGIGSPELSIDVHSVKKAQWVKIETENLPANVSFKVYMNKPGAAPRKAVLVGTLRDSKGGNIVATFDIPASIKDRTMLEIIVVNNALEMNAEATFDNKTTR